MLLGLVGKRSNPPVVKLHGSPATTFTELAFFLAAQCDQGAMKDPFVRGSVTNVTQDNLRDFLGEEGARSRVLLFQCDDAHGKTLQELAWFYPGAYAFGIVAQTEIGLLESFAVRSLP